MSRSGLLITCMFLYMVSSAHHRKLDSLLTVLSAETSDSAKIKILNAISVQYGLINEAETSIKFAGQALSLSEKLNFLKDAGQACHSIGNGQIRMGNYPEALRYFLKALHIGEKTNDKKRMGAAYNNIGLVYYRQLNYEEALKYYQAAIIYKQETGDTKGIATTLMNVGLILREKKNYKVALENLSRSRKIYEELGDKVGLGYLHNNVGQTFLKMYDDGKTEIGIDHKTTLDNSVNNLKIAEKYFLDAGEQQGLSMVYLNLADVYLRTKDISEAHKVIANGLRIAHSVKALHELRDAYGTLSEINVAERNFRDAFENYKLFVIYSDSISNEENTKKSVAAQLQYEFDKKETEAKAVQAKKDAVALEEKRKQNIVLWCVACGLALVAVFAGFVFHAYRQKQRANVEIARQKDVIEEKQKEILDSIYYARRIQRALVTSEWYVAKNLKRLRERI